MLGHVLVQIPVVAAAGFVLGLRVEPRIRSALRTVNAGGIPGILLVSFTIAFWMIPRWLDGSLTSDTIAVAKYLSLVLLRVCPRGAGRDFIPVARGVVKNEVSAVLAGAWLSPPSPV